MSLSKTPAASSSGDDCDADVGFTTRILIQGLYPYKRQDSITRSMQAGPWRMTVTSPNGIPYGKYPRLVMAYLVTQAVQRQNLPPDEARRIPLGRSINDFLSRMGIATRGTGGKQTGNLRILREQLRRLSTSTVTVEHLSRADRDAGANMMIVQRWELWWGANAHQEPLEESWIQLTPDFYEEIIAHPVPIDLDMLRGLSRPRAMDIYMWSTARRYRLKADLHLDWDAIQSQFGADVQNTSQAKRDFRKDFKKAVAEVTDVWPDAGLTVTPDGLILAKGRPSVLPRRSRH